MQNELAGKHFKDDTDVKNWPSDYFTSKPKVFYERGNRKLPGKWANVLLRNGDYLE